jgi:hypothetical protein
LINTAWAKQYSIVLNYLAVTNWFVWLYHL